MFIATERTPNPRTLKFLPGRSVMAAGTAEFTSPAQAEASPLATALMAEDGVEGVFFGRDFISVTQSGEDWTRLKPQVLAVIMDHFIADLPLFHPGAEAASKAPVQAEDGDEIASQIIQILDEKVRPAVAQDGGDIIYEDFKDGVVYLKMQGACSGCPSSTMTLKNGIENLLKYYVPEVTEVRPV